MDIITSRFDEQGRLIWQAGSNKLTVTASECRDLHNCMISASKVLPEKINAAQQVIWQRWDRRRVKPQASMVIPETFIEHAHTHSSGVDPAAVKLQRDLDEAKAQVRVTARVGGSRSRLTLKATLQLAMELTV
jgi:hypothetical protein